MVKYTTKEEVFGSDKSVSKHFWQCRCFTVWTKRTKRCKVCAMEYTEQVISIQDIIRQRPTIYANELCEGMIIILLHSQYAKIADNKNGMIRAIETVQDVNTELAYPAPIHEIGSDYIFNFKRVLLEDGKTMIPILMTSEQSKTATKIKAMMY